MYPVNHTIYRYVLLHSLLLRPEKRRASSPRITQVTTRRKELALSVALEKKGFMKKVIRDVHTGDFMKKVPLATWARRDI